MTYIHITKQDYTFLWTVSFQTKHNVRCIFKYATHTDCFIINNNNWDTIICYDKKEKVKVTF